MMANAAIFLAAVHFVKGMNCTRNGRLGRLSGVFQNQNAAVAGRMFPGTIPGAVACVTALSPTQKRALIDAAAPAERPAVERRAFRLPRRCERSAAPLISLRGQAKRLTPSASCRAS
jgi:hypothetical protein